MHKKWINIIFLLPLVAILCFVNVYEDPANMFHNNSEAIAREIINGNAVYFSGNNADERAIKQDVISMLPKHLECITIGPSLSMGITSEDVGTESYHNLSASGLNFNDFLAITAFLSENEIEVDRVILCVDFYFFMEASYSYGSLKEEYMPYANYMASILKGEDAKLSKKLIPDEFENQIRLLFSVSYFQSSVAFIKSNHSFRLPVSHWGIVDENTEKYAHYLPDGSWVYMEDYRNNTEEDVIDHAEEYGIEGFFSKGDHISEYSKEMFVRLIEYYENRGAEVVLFLSPFSPALWERVQNDADADQYYSISEIENFANEVASEYGLKITGSYNPENVGIQNSDFYDARHMRSESYSKYFDLK